MTELLLGVFIAVIIAMWAWERFQWERKEQRWAAERKELLNRLMARDWPSYLALQQSEVEIQATHEEPTPKTNDYDKAWTA